MILLPDEEEFPLWRVFPLQPHVLFLLVTALLGA